MRETFGKRVERGKLIAQTCDDWRESGPAALSVNGSGHLGFDVVEIRTVIPLLAHCNSNDGCESQAVSCVTDASE